MNKWTEKRKETENWFTRCKPSHTGVLYLMTGCLHSWIGQWVISFLQLNLNNAHFKKVTIRWVALYVVRVETVTSGVAQIGLNNGQGLPKGLKYDFCYPLLTSVFYFFIVFIFTFYKLSKQYSWFSLPWFPCIDYKFLKIIDLLSSW